jgi:hypothetical protein
MSLWLAGYPKTPGFDVRFGSKADMGLSLVDVGFTPKSGHSSEAELAERSQQTESSSAL